MNEMNYLVTKEEKQKYEKIIIGLLILIITILGSEIFYEALGQTAICNIEKNQSYNSGVTDGMKLWDSMVVGSINENDELPYIINDTVITIPLQQLCLK